MISKDLLARMPNSMRLTALVSSHQQRPDRQRKAYLGIPNTDNGILALQSLLQPWAQSPDYISSATTV